MTATLDDIHRDPAILDQAIALGEPLEIVNNGVVTATLIPTAKPVEPDFLARAKRIWGECPPGTPLSEIVSASRGQSAVLYLDTGCLVKLYYPEANSASVAEAVAGETIGFTALHALELTTALQAKVFRSEATREQADAAHAAVEEDLASGKLVRLDCDWAAAWKEAQTLAFQHAATTGCRALDTLHRAVARALAAREMLTTDARQTTLATAAGIALRRW